MKLGAVEKLGDGVDVVVGFDMKVESILLALSTLTKSTKGKERCMKTQLYPQLLSIIESNTEKPECEVFILKFSYFSKLMYFITGNATIF